ncbi:DUF397 domain-containing protein [Sphaerisporangium sp. NPDC051011]|uniref:DUF397 domain-containing protein n=1 Tax=Sphaerisporangium sp. NPDC051011 TaxID=3155792 RepID=UPI0033FE4BA4
MTANPPQNTWFTSSHSGENGGCVEVRLGGSNVAVRDSKGPNGPRLVLTHQEWRLFTQAIKEGKLPTSC